MDKLKISEQLDNLSGVGIMIESIKHFLIITFLCALGLLIECLVFIGGGLLVYKITGFDSTWAIFLALWFINSVFLHMFVIFSNIHAPIWVKILTSLALPLVRLTLFLIVINIPITLIGILTFMFFYSLYTKHNTVVDLKKQLRFLQEDNI